MTPITIILAIGVWIVAGLSIALAVAVLAQSRRIDRLELARRIHARILNRLSNSLIDSSREMFEIVDAIRQVLGPAHVTKDGHLLRLHDMTTLHLVNLWTCLDAGEKRDEVEEVLRLRARNSLEEVALGTSTIGPAIERAGLLQKWHDWQNAAWSQRIADNESHNEHKEKRA